jgi:type III pantothenate kinase
MKTASPQLQEGPEMGESRLVVDVGNTETALGLVDPSGPGILGHWRLSSGVPRTGDEMHLLLRSLLLQDGVDLETVAGAVVGSVVPSVTESFRGALERIFPGRVVVVDRAEGLPIRLDVEEPRTVGVDRFVNTLAASRLYERDTIAVDLGTATTFDCITADGVFLGGVISPGILSGEEWLARRTAKLPRVDFRPPGQVIGRRTETCLHSGLFYSVIDAVDGIVDRIRREWGTDPLVVATGGFAGLVAPHSRSVERTEPHLTLYGLAMAGEILG